MRNYDTPLTIVLSGFGTSDDNNTRALLEDFIFGPPENDKVDVKVVVPFSGKTSPVMASALKILAEWGITGEDFLPIVEPDSGHRSISAAETSIQVDQGDAMPAALRMLAEHADNGREVAYLSFYNPENVRDIDNLENAKRCEGLTTLNICEGLIDSFSGYESDADRIMREALEDSFAEQEKAKAVEDKPSPAPRKTAAKKATTPRKRAAAKVVVAEDELATEEPEKAPEKPLSGTQALVAEAVAREEAKRAARTELSGTIVTGKAELPKELEPAKSLKAVAKEYVDNNPDVWKDVALAVPQTVEYTAHDVEQIMKQQAALADLDGKLTVDKRDIVQLGDAMKKMAEGFGDAIEAYKRIVEGN